MSRRGTRALALLLFLAACAQPVVLQNITIPLRNPTAPVASQSDVTLARLSGDWVVVQGAGLAPGTKLRIAADSATLNGVVMPLRDTGQGRLLLGTDSVWVHWLDYDNRTAAMGNPSGSRVWIMDRKGKPGERLGAARKILNWYGYDLTRMQNR